MAGARTLHVGAAVVATPWAMNICMKARDRHKTRHAVRAHAAVSKNHLPVGMSMAQRGGLWRGARHGIAPKKRCSK